MKHLKASPGDLRRLFERAITIREIAEPLVSFDTDRNAEAIRAFMEAQNFDVVGLRESGRLVGYVCRNDLKQGPVQGCLTRFQEGEVLAESEPLSSAIQGLRHRSELFITVLGQVGGIVTKGDLQKVPVRLWLFGVISLIEMQMLRLIRERFPHGTCMSLLKTPRVKAAKRIFAARKQRNEEADVSDFSDCLQIHDKATILLQDSELRALARFSTPEIGQNFFKQLTPLRNALAHGNDILKDRWPALVDLAQEAEALLARLELASVLTNAE
jgi:hypothetical protein